MALSAELESQLEAITVADDDVAKVRLIKITELMRLKALEVGQLSNERSDLLATLTA